MVYEAPLVANTTRLIGIIEDWHDLYASAEGIMEDIQKFEYDLNYSDTYYGKFKFAKDGEDLDYFQYPDATVLYPAKYLDENGGRIIMNQGKTWVCIIWNQYADDVVIE